MPTQEEINAANVELEIANDNYARLADKYNRYQKAFQTYANASPETQAKAQGFMQKALASYEQLRLDMYAAEDRIQQAQNRVNSYADIQPMVVAPAGQRRRQVYVPETVIEPTSETIVQPVPEVIASNIPTQGNAIQINSEYVPGNWINNYPGHSNATMIAANSRFPTPQTIAEREGTWGSRWSTYPSGPSRTFGYNTPNYIPNEIQRVRGLRGNDYLQGMKDLEKYRGYNVINQNAYKNGNKWTLN